MKLTLLTALVSLFLVSCNSLWDRANRGELRKDLEEVLERSGIAVQLANCQMQGTTRTGHCLLEADQSELELIAVSLEMGVAHSMGPSEGAQLPTFLIDSPCLANLSSIPAEEARAYLITGRPNQLQLADGGQFEYMLIAFTATSENACVEASYAYG